jgi:hypothetical protein
MESQLALFNDGATESQSEVECCWYNVGGNGNLYFSKNERLAHHSVIEDTSKDNNILFVKVERFISGTPPTYIYYFPDVASQKKKETFLTYKDICSSFENFLEFPSQEKFKETFEIYQKYSIKKTILEKSGMYMDKDIRKQIEEKMLKSLGCQSL